MQEVRRTRGSYVVGEGHHATRRTPHRASRLVQQMSAWLVKSRRAPPWHYKDATVSGHVTTAMHDMSTPPPPLPPECFPNVPRFHPVAGINKYRYALCILCPW